MNTNEAAILRLLLLYSNLLLLTCLVVLALNTFIFCRQRGRCKTPPTRSVVGSASRGVVANIEISFITLMTAAATLSYALHCLARVSKGENLQVYLQSLRSAFILPIIVAACFSFDLRRYMELHIFLGWTIVGFLVSMATNSYEGALICILIGASVAKRESVRNKVPLRSKVDLPTRRKIDINTLIFGLGVFIPVFYLVLRNRELYNSL